MGYPFHARPIILYYFFPAISIEISTFHIRTSMVQGVCGVIFKCSINSYGTCVMGMVIIDITMGCEINGSNKLKDYTPPPLGSWRSLKEMYVFPS